MTRVAVFTLGGTISMTTSENGGIVPTLSGDSLLAPLGNIDDVAVEVVDFPRFPAASLNVEILIEVAVALREAWARGVDGVVITQGTDTMEETAFFFDLLHNSSNTVVVTGAMRSPEQPGADGPANLAAAIRVAAVPDTRDLGVLVVLNDEIHAARRVRKAHSVSMNAFQSPVGGVVGYMLEGRPVVLNRFERQPSFTPESLARKPHVGFVTASLFEEGAFLVDVEKYCDGLVVAGVGAGHVHEKMAPALRLLAESIPVVLSSRTSGPTLTSTYGFPGSEIDLIGAGLIPSGFLDPLKARILLYVLLASGADADAVRAAFATFGLADPSRNGM